MYPIDSIVIIQMLSAFTGGKTVSVVGDINEDIEAGSVVVDNSGTLEILQSGACQTAAAAVDTSIKLYKKHHYKVGDDIKSGIAITAIDTSNDDYDLLSLDAAIGVIVALDEAVVTDGDQAIGIVIGSKVIRENDTVDVGVMYRGEMNEAVVTPYAPINAAVKTALPHVVFS